MNVYVGNLSYDMSEDDLRAEFSPFGEVDSARIISDRDTGRSKGFGFVEMPNDDEARKAMDALNGKDVGGRQLKVNEARPKEDRPRRTGGFGGGRGGGGGGRW